MEKVDSLNGGRAWFKLAIIFATLAGGLLIISGFYVQREAYQEDDLEVIGLCEKIEEHNLDEIEFEGFDYLDFDSCIKGLEYHKYIRNTWNQKHFFFLLIAAILGLNSVICCIFASMKKELKVEGVQAILVFDSLLFLIGMYLYLTGKLTEIFGAFRELG